MNSPVVYIRLALCCLIFYNGVYGQARLYANEFPLSDVVLLDGPFKHARDLNIQTILQYDVDRLLAPFRREAGLPAKAAMFSNWAGLDGHVGGHYLSALAMNYAATGNAECRKRMEYMIHELKACQDAMAKSNPGWGVGYIGGVPNSKEVWSTLKKGDFKAYRSAWVPWYNIHKLYAGLRDAWLYTGNEDARNMFLKYCDWGINIISDLSDVQQQLMLDTEHGGMNEIFADAWQMTHDRKYLAAARRFSHKDLLDAMAARTDNLDNKHANTQVPKAVGFQRIAEIGHEKSYSTAAAFFWETVMNKRSLAFGGNSRREFFPPDTACHEFIDEAQGPETCNTFNMLRLTEGLFRMNPLADFMDYYERALYNHILSSQHPGHGGFVYFTPARPRHYRVYSAPNEAMWCCVGSGMENPSKYNQVIYTHRNDSLFLNLFIASSLDWKAKGIRIKQETNFPNEEQTRLTVAGGSSRFTLMIRYPSWVNKGSMKIKINGKEISYTKNSMSYIAIARSWTKGDVVVVTFPMHTTIERLPNVPSYIAILHGPILLGARMGGEDLKGLVAGAGRWEHIAGGKKLPVDEAPSFVTGNAEEIAGRLKPVKGKSLHFTVSGIETNNASNIVLEPFYQIHDARYMIYWKVSGD